MKGEGRQGVDPDGLGQALSVSATRRGFLTARSLGEGRDQRADCSRRHAGTGLARDSQACGESAGRVRRRRRDQEGSGRVRSLARAALNWFCKGQPWGRCRVRRFGCGRDGQVVASVGCSLFRVGLPFHKPLSPKQRSTFLPLHHPATITSSVDWGLGRAGNASTYDWTIESPVRQGINAYPE